MISRITHGTSLTQQLGLDPSVPQVFDFAEPERGGFDPEAGLVLTEMAVTGRVATGHTANLDDPDAPILIREGDISGAPGSGTMFVEGRCRACIARTAIFREDGGTLLVLEHEP